MHRSRVWRELCQFVRGSFEPSVTTPGPGLDGSLISLISAMYCLALVCSFDLKHFLNPNHVSCWMSYVPDSMLITLEENLIKNECTFKDNEMTMGLPSTSVFSVSSYSFSSASNMQLALLHIRGTIYITVSVNGTPWNSAAHNLQGCCGGLACLFHFSV